MDIARFITGGIRPLHGQADRRAASAVEWLLRAQRATPDEGVSYGYFPCGSDPPWGRSYPETTGYIITSLLQYATAFGRADVRARALTMADWEISIQMPSGAVQGGAVQARDGQTPCAFNTGMVLDGWCTAYAQTKSEPYLEAAQRATNWLIDALDPHGYFRTNGEFVRRDEVKTYNVLCAWSMYRYGNLASDGRARDAAVHVTEGALRKQQRNGWFDCNCLSRPEAPLLHTIGYTLQGVLEVGALASRADFVDAARRGLDPVLANMSRNGFLPARYDRHWRPAARYCCLTGSAQVAVVCYRLAQLIGETRYRLAADRIVNFLKCFQLIESPDPGIQGALAGSFPMFAEYKPGGYPNWATKYLLDALMLQFESQTVRSA
jgi:uncharacterized protein YyaL (SSP411 family)